MENEMVSLELLHAAQTLACNAEVANHASSYIDYDYAHGCYFIEFYTLTTLDVSISVRILCGESIKVETKASKEFNENGEYLDDYLYLQQFADKLFDNHEEFIKKVSEFFDLI